jgi:enoyl-CoA hydratase
VTEHSHLLVDRVGAEGRVLRITLNRPEVLNALAPATFGELRTALEEAEVDPDIRVIILRGSGRAFSVGHDLGNDQLDESAFTPDARFRTRDEAARRLPLHIATELRQITDIMLYFWRIPKVTIVEAHGYCLGGGFELAMMADLVVASDDCLFGHPAHRGVGVARNAMILPLVMGMRKAKELFYTGDGVTGQRAVELGMINYSWPAETLASRTLALADRVGNLSSDHLGALKTAMNSFYENMGIYGSVYSSTRMDAMSQFTESAHAWQELLETKGVKGAVAHRDGAYADYSTTPPSDEALPSPPTV